MVSTSYAYFDKDDAVVSNDVYVVVVVTIAVQVLPSVMPCRV